MIKQRLIFGVLMAGGFLGLLAADWRLEAWGYGGLLPAGAGGALFAGLVMLLALGGSVELSRLARAKGVRPLVATGAVVAAGLAGSPFLARLHPRLAPLPLVVLAFGTMLIFLVQALARRTADAIPTIAATLLGVCYLGGLAAFVVQIRLEYAAAGLLIYLAAVKLTDVGAWAAGMTLGRHKLVPWLSPGKTWEGLAGGLLAAVAASLAFGLATGLLGWWQAMVFGLVLAPAGQCGDLAESLLKRDAGVKDSGSLLPGFGGLLDVLDSPLGAAPVGYLLLHLLAS